MLPYRFINELISSSSVSVTPTGNGTTKADYSAINNTISSNVTLGNILNEPTSSKSNITLKVYLYETEEIAGSPASTIPEWFDCWIGAALDGDWTYGTLVYPTYNTQEGHMTIGSDDKGAYLSYTFSSLSVGTINYYILVERSSTVSSGFTWGHEFENLSFELSKYDEDGKTFTADIAVGESLEDWLPETSSFEITMALKNTNAQGSGSDKTFYMIGMSYTGEWGQTTGTALSKNNDSSLGYDLYVTEVMDKTASFSLWIGGASTYTWKYGLGSADSSNYWNANCCYASVSYDSWTFYPEEMSGNQWDAATSLTIILSFDFSQFSSSSENYLVSSISCIY